MIRADVGNSGNAVFYLIIVGIANENKKAMDYDRYNL